MKKQDASSDQTSSERKIRPCINYDNESDHEYSDNSLIPDGSSNSTFQEPSPATPPTNQISIQDGVPLKEESPSGADQKKYFAARKTCVGKTSECERVSDQVSGCFADEDLNSGSVGRRNEQATKEVNNDSGGFAEQNQASSSSSSTLDPLLDLAVDATKPKISTSPSSSSSSFSLLTSPSALSSSVDLCFSSGSISGKSSIVTTEESTVSPQLFPNISSTSVLGLHSQLFGHIPNSSQDLSQTFLSGIKSGNVLFIVVPNGNNTGSLIPLAAITQEGQHSDRQIPVTLLVPGQIESSNDPCLESLDLSIRRHQPSSLAEVKTFCEGRSKGCDSTASGGVENHPDGSRTATGIELAAIMMKHPNVITSNIVPIISISTPSPSYFSQTPVTYVSSSPSSSFSSSSSSSSSISSSAPSVLPAYAVLVPPPQKVPSHGNFALPSASSPALSLSSSFNPTNPTLLSPTTKQFACNLCGKVYNSEKYLSMHLSIHNPISQRSVTQPNMSSLMEKKISAHPDDDSQSLDTIPSKKPFNASNPSVNQSHEMTIKISMNPQRQFGIETSPGDLGEEQRNLIKGKPNVKLVAGGGQWKCKLCDKFFAQNSNYKNHMRTHSNERPYVCEICSIGFKERYHLKKHILFKHSDEAKEQCRVCGKRFKDSTAVRAHERTHSTDRPYSCPRCHKSFKTSECLWHHENRSKTCGKTIAGVSKVEAPENVQIPSLECKSVRRKKSDVPVNPSDIIEEIASIPLSTCDEYVEQYGNHQIHQSHLQYQTAANNPQGEVQHQQNSQQQQLYYIQQSNQHMVYRQIQLANSNFTQVHQKHLLLQDLKSHENSQVVAHQTGCLSVKGSNKNSLMNCSLSPSGNLNMPSWSVPVSFSVIKSSEEFEQRPNAAEHQSHFIFDRQDSSNSLSGIKFEDSFQLSETYLSIETSLENQNESSGEKLFEGQSRQRFSDEVNNSSKTLFNHNEFHVVQEEECLDENRAAEEKSGLQDCYEVNGEVKSEILGLGSRYEYQQQQQQQLNLLEEKPPSGTQTTSSSLQSSNFYSLSTIPCNSFQQQQQQQEQQQQQRKLINQQEMIQQTSTSSTESERPFKCEICHSGFKLKVHLKKHQLYKHSDDYPCECKFCKKRFKDSSAVRLHERTHSEERPFSCECGKSFKTRENLWGHKHRGPCDFNSSKDLKTTLGCLQTSVGNKACPANGSDQVGGLKANQTTFDDSKMDTGMNFSSQSSPNKDIQRLHHFESVGVERDKMNDNSPPFASATFLDNCQTSIHQQQQQLQPLDHTESKMVLTRKRSCLSPHSRKFSVPLSSEVEHSLAHESKMTSKQIASTMAMTTNLPTAVVVPIKRKKAELCPGEVPTYSMTSPSNSQSDVGSNISVSSTQTLSTPRQVYMNSSNHHFGSETRPVDGESISFPTPSGSSEGSAIAQMTCQGRRNKGGIVLPGNGLVFNMELLVGSKPSLPPFESLLFQAEQSRSPAFNGRAQTADSGVDDSRSLYQTNACVFVSAPRSVQK